MLKTDRTGASLFGLGEGAQPRTHDNTAIQRLAFHEARHTLISVLQGTRTSTHIDRSRGEGRTSTTTNRADARAAITLTQAAQVAEKRNSVQTLLILVATS